LKKLYAFAEEAILNDLRNDLFEAGGGMINGQQQLSYATLGVGTNDGIGKATLKLELLFPIAIQGKIQRILRNYEATKGVNYDIISVENTNYQIGSGMIGELPKSMEEKTFFKHLKEQMQVTCIKHTALSGKKIKKVAFCGGAGGFLLKQAIRQQADIFITADYKYHEFFDADNKIIIADIGHYESEQFTINLLHEVLTQKYYF